MPANSKTTTKTTTRRARRNTTTETAPNMTTDATDNSITPQQVTAVDQPDSQSTDGQDNQGEGHSDDKDTQPVSTPAASKKKADPKVLMVSAVLSDYPAGVTIGQIADECGLGPTTVDKLLYVMEFQGAAVKIDAKPSEGAPELWLSGTTRATEVDLTQLPPQAAQHCATCTCGGHRSRSAASIRRVSLEPGKNSDGSRKFSKGELRQLVHNFVNELGPGHIHTATNVTNELRQRLNGRDISSGAVLNNLRTLAATGQITLHTEKPEQFTANPAAPGSDDADGE